MGKSEKNFFGFAIVVDLRNFSEICRRLLIQDGKEHKASNSLKKDIYSLFFSFLTSTLDTVSNNNRGLIFEYKHTGDGFLFITNHNKRSKPIVNSLSAFRLLLNIWSILDKSIPSLNADLRTILWEEDNQGVIKKNRQLVYIKNLFTDFLAGRPKDHITFSIGAHCGKVFSHVFGDKTLLLGNTINLAARLQELSKTFAEFNLFFSHKIINMLKEYVKDYGAPLSEMMDLKKIDIRGIGPTRVYTIPEDRIASVIKCCDNKKIITKATRKR